MLTEIANTQYCIKVAGVDKGARYSSVRLAEMAINDLPPDQRTLAQVVIVEAASGKELLLG